MNILKSLAVMACAAIVASTMPAAAQNVTGAGASFPAPLYQRWASEYKKTSGVSVNYQSVGSGAGIAQIRARAVDFGATDAPLNLADQKDASLFQFPMVAGGIVPVVNIPGVKAGQMRFTGMTLSEIFMGKITKWNDPKIAAENPNVSLPDADITIVRRSDSSGTTSVFTAYLAEVNSSFLFQVGTGTTVRWPKSVGAKGNEGVAATVGQTPNSIGYTEYSFGKKLAWTLVQSKAGTFPKPSGASFAAAIANAAWTNKNGYRQITVNKPGANTWPITAVTYILVPTNPSDAATSKAVLAFFEWAYEAGDKTAEALDYVPLPSAVAAQVKADWAAKIKN